MISGYTDARFSGVEDVFRQGFASGVEGGASVAVWIDGRFVVDLYGGFMDRAGIRPWTESTLVNVYSTTKAVVAFLAAMLVDEGKLSYDARASRYWPEFAAEGKEEITLRQLLSHQSGVAAPGEPLITEDLYDWSRMVSVLERTPPLFRPGSATAYQARVFGFLIGEVLRRVTGQSVGALLRSRLTDPLGSDFLIGVPASEDRRCSEVVAPAKGFGTATNEVKHRVAGSILDLMGQSVLDGSQALPGEVVCDMMHRVFTNPVNPPEVPNDRAWRAAEIPSSNGHANARGIAKIFAPLAGDGSYGNVQYISPSTLREATSLCSDGMDLTLGMPIRWSCGFTLNGGEFGPNREAFGHRGLGGSMGFADPTARLSFGYAMTNLLPMLGEAAGNDPRAEGLVDALYRCL